MNTVAVCVDCVVLCGVLGILNAAPWSPSTIDAPKPCCLPNQLSMDMGETVASVSQGHPALTQLAGWTAIDYPKKKLATLEMGYSEGQPFNLSVIADYEEGVMYTIDNSARKCTKSKVPPTAMSAQCIPDDAQYMGTVKFGMGTVLSGDNWAVKIKDEQSKVDITAFITVTSDSCVPINEGITEHLGASDLDVFVGASFYNIKDKIDPSVFNVPDICKNADVVPTKQTRNFLVHKQYLI